MAVCSCVLVCKTYNHWDNYWDTCTVTTSLSSLPPLCPPYHLFVLSTTFLSSLPPLCPPSLFSTLPYLDLFFCTYILRSLLRGGFEGPLGIFVTWEKIVGGYFLSRHEDPKGSLEASAEVGAYFAYFLLDLYENLKQNLHFTPMQLISY